MGHNIDLTNYKIRTDLAIEAIDNQKIKGIVSKEINEDGIKITEVMVNEEASQIINKKKGHYITIEFSDVTDYENSKKVEKKFSRELSKLINKLNISNYLRFCTK